MRNLAMAVVVRDSKVLLQHRYRHSVGFVYEFPGGSIDGDEHPEEAALRELEEETGLRLTNVLGLHSYTNDFGGLIHFVVVKENNLSEPKALVPERQQTFYWLSHTDIPLDDFYKSDLEFIDAALGKYI
ncbi:NUDIX hydrolase [Reinekea forsetii]|nr:NUDIX hydrolase [Reinekea forsetii]